MVNNNADQYNRYSFKGTWPQIYSLVAAAIVAMWTVFYVSNVFLRQSINDLFSVHRETVHNGAVTRDELRDILAERDKRIYLILQGIQKKGPYE